MKSVFKSQHILGPKYEVKVEVIFTSFCVNHWRKDGRVVFYYNETRLNGRVKM